MIDNNPIELRFSHKARPSWQSFGEGRRSLRVKIHPKGKWLELSLAEYGEKSTKETFITLPQEDLIKIRDAINSIFQNPKHWTDPTIAVPEWMKGKTSEG